MSARSDRARDIARWRRMTMTDDQLREIAIAADQKLADEDEETDLYRYCSDCGDPIPNQQCGGLCEDCLAKGVDG